MDKFLLVMLFYTLSGMSQEEFKSAQYCGKCHQIIYQEWISSLHANSTPQKDPLFRGMYDLAIEETAGKLTEKCIVCHSPLATVLQDYSREVDFNQEGVTCQFCHGTSEIIDFHSAKDRKIDLDTIYSDQPDLERAAHPLTHRDFFYKSEFCLPCHAEMKNPADIEVCATGSEWRDYFKETGKNCQDCHLLNREREVSHLFPGTHQNEFPAETIEMELAYHPNTQELQISLLNSGAGHSIPTGTPLRMVYLKVTACDSSGKTVWENWIDNPMKEDRSGLFMKILGDEQGNGPVVPWKASQIIYDRRLMPGKQLTVKYMLPGKNLFECEVKLIYRFAPAPILQRLGVTDPHFLSERILAQQSMFLPQAAE